MTHYKKQLGDVKWTAPGYKKPIAYSTVATSHLITAIMDKADTILSLRKKIVYDTEAKAVLDKYIACGFGNVIASTWFR